MICHEVFVYTKVSCYTVQNPIHRTAQSVSHQNSLADLSNRTLSTNVYNEICIHCLEASYLYLCPERRSRYVFSLVHTQINPAYNVK